MTLKKLSNTEEDFNVAEFLLMHEALNAYKANNAEVETHYQGSNALITEVIRKVKAKGIQLEGEGNTNKTLKRGG